MIIPLLLWPQQTQRGKNQMPVSTYHHSIVYKIMRMNDVGEVVFSFSLIKCIRPNQERNQTPS